MTLCKRGREEDPIGLPCSEQAVMFYKAQRGTEVYFVALCPEHGWQEGHMSKLARVGFKIQMISEDEYKTSEILTA